ncbi:hypothetical protein SAMN04489761_3063 [Tenacibaculum sp. MAR_2009_124]|uniref:hypothetical protein n=1 Tax=Tenacibaculum sp. MAR_2009_124 TaxID=1250059 RepID=UPI000894EBBA|nr:hypothetical protein [Tenacibaculum sp. MAR_2009_124]SEC46317.1 hypothetical protein SAMN04489761_3063 [Tenacibaculum sp. MAR_2009_124]
MQQVKLSIGQSIANVGEVKGLHFSDLFTMSYRFNEDEYYELDEIKENILLSKNTIQQKLVDKLKHNPSLVFKFLHKRMMKTQNLYLINKLNEEVTKLKTLLGEDLINWNSYSYVQKVKNTLEDFFFIYYLR